MGKNKKKIELIPAKYITKISEWAGISVKYFKSKLIGLFLDSYGQFLSEMDVDFDFLMKNATWRKNNVLSEAFAIVRKSKNQQSAFVFVFNERDREVEYRILLQEHQIEDTLGIISPIDVPAKSVKILPYHIKINESLKLLFSTLESYGCYQVSEKNVVLLFRGEPGEDLHASLKINGVVYHVDGLVNSVEDIFWRFDNDDCHVIVGLINNSRAEYTLAINIDKENGWKYPIISNFPMEFQIHDGILQIQHIDDSHEKFYLSLPSFMESGQIHINKNIFPIKFDSEIGVSSIGL